MPTLHTARLRLDRLSGDDAPALFAYRSTEDVARYQNWRPANLEEAAGFIERNATAVFDQPDTWCQLAVRLAESAELVGDLGVHFVGDDGHQVEIGFTIASPHQGRGLGTEAVRGLLDHLFLEMGKHRVHASVDPRNTPSLALLERVGLRKEAHFRQSLFWKGTWADDVVYAVLASEWKSRQSAVS